MQLSDIPRGCFHELFEAQVERAPARPAVAYGEEHLTYRELNQKANRLAHYLGALGVGPETLVGICMERAPEMMVGLLGILKAGAAYLPLDPSYPNDRLAYMLDDAKAPVVLAQRRLLDKVAGAGGEVVCIDENWPAIARQSGENPASGVRQDNLAYVIYTSGSTGKPKGVMIHHRGLVNYLCWASRNYRMWEGEGALVHSPIGFDLTITTIFAPLLVGQKVVLLAEGAGIDQLAAALGAARDFTVVKITPTHLEALAHMVPEKELAGRARVLVIGGEMLRWEHIAAWRRHAPATRLINEYGPTETVVGCAVYEVAADAVESGSVPIGRAIDNMEMHLLDAGMGPVPAGEIGEIYIGGVGVARGYLNQPETTRAKFILRPANGTPGARLYKTGDLARLLPDGELEYLGRTDHQVKVRGYRIELGEIEVVLAQHPAVRDCAVLAREDASTSLSAGGAAADKRLVAYVVGRDGTAPAVEDLRAFLQARLPAYMVPAAFVAMEEFPVTVNGKIDRDALPAPRQQRANGETYKEPTDTLEIQLAAIWEEILGVSPIGAADNFFELGGDSLQAVLMATKVEEVRGRHIPPAMLIEENTIEKLARAIHRIDLEPRDTTIVEVQPKGSLPPLYLVPGIGGMVLGLSYLAQRLGTDQPLYGLQARGVKDAESPCASIEEMARYYIEAIRKAQPEGPYFIGGYSFGGIVAFEMARQLRAGGQELGILAVFDTEAPGPRRFSPVGFIRNLPYWCRDFILRRKPGEVAGDAFTKGKNLAKKVLNKGFARFGMPSTLKRKIEEDVDMPQNWPERYRRVIETHYKALLGYQPDQYQGRLTLFRTRAQPLLRAYPDNGWSRLVQGDIDVYGVDGLHANFLQEPHVRSVATQVRMALEKSRNLPGGRPRWNGAASGAGRKGSMQPSFPRSSKQADPFPGR
ncbi:MAG TPA: amino acid adenylation domain-containing protein [Candidatus Binatia bacterium]